MALSFGTTSSGLISVVCRKTRPLASSCTVRGLASPSSDWALVRGRSSGTPAVRSGAEIMKTISSTSITSTKGVTLISLIGLWRRARRGPRGAPRVAGGPLSGSLVDLAGQDRRELVREALEAERLARHLARELVVGDGCRDGRQQPERR